MPFICTNFEIKHYRFFFYFLERWQMPVKATIYKIIKIFCFFLW